MMKPATTNRSTIHAIELENFTAFTRLDLRFSTGINVIVGENSTGKTHLMKLLYCLLKANHSILDKRAFSIDKKQSEIAFLLQAYFKPDHLGRLVKRQQGTSSAKVRITIDTENQSNRAFDFGFSTRSKTNVQLSESAEIHGLSSLFIPPVELLTISEGFIGAYDNRETAYDRTYYDLAKALELNPLRGPRSGKASELVGPLEKHTGITVTKENNRFYLKFKGGGMMEAPIVAEGLKKLGMLIYLINNGSIGSNSILFWDEPEAHLNPRYIKIVVDFLCTLAHSGVQIFVSTHDYLLSQRLSLIAEQPTDSNAPKPPMKFISLYPGKDGVIGEVVNNLSEMKNNPILDEFADYADEEERQMMNIE